MWCFILYIHLHLHLHFVIIMQPIRVSSWMCPLCYEIYDFKEDAQACADKLVNPPKYHRGQYVYLCQSVPNDPDVPFVRRQIISIIGLAPAKDCEFHTTQYKLDEAVLVDRDEHRYFVGTKSDDTEDYADESDFYEFGDNNCRGIFLSDQTLILDRALEA